jgi:DNA (cytosine-5)-methyltransferase 1
VTATYGVIDLFAGPGGLNEGFSGLSRDDRRPFCTVISAEMEASAHATLRLRAFIRAHLAQEGTLPPGYETFHKDFAASRGSATAAQLWSAHPLWAEAEAEARQLTLGSEDARAPLAAASAAAQKVYDELIVIGGPPCQAYSLVGRARNQGNKEYEAEKDLRHFLFREYIGVLRSLHPAMFVMENVKGILSSSVGGRGVFKMIMDDLRSLGGGEDGLYELIPLSPRTPLRDTPQDFIVRAENHGVPQRRHRVIIVGVRRDVAAAWRKRGGDGTEGLLQASKPATVRDVLAGFPALRSGLSREADDPLLWADVRGSVARFLADMPDAEGMATTEKRALRDLPGRMHANALLLRTSSGSITERQGAPEALIRFLTRAGFQHVAQHDTRAHIRADLARYMFAAAVGEAAGVSPKAKDFPEELAPEHANWASGKFNDRFRAQLWDAPSTTVTSHIAKDGHYFIHPDPTQCRALTVREAARLQTFPDDYLFLGNRTQQYTQVGNAVPPFLARQIAEAVLGILE